MNILSIGNSFSQDAHRYLHNIAKADRYALNTFNIVIGGCSLSTHYRNMMGEVCAYALEMNGESTGFKVSIKEALLSRDWDIITVQQVSWASPDYETYQPYLNEIISYIRRMVPKAKIALHYTWAYEQNSKRLNEELGYKNRSEMYADIVKSYNMAAKEIDVDFIIPSATLFEKLTESGVEKIHRDTFHASFGIGRYALGLLWYSVISGNDITENNYSDFDEEISAVEIDTAIKCVKNMMDKYKGDRVKAEILNEK